MKLDPQFSQTLGGSPGDYDRLLNKHIDEAPLALLGEASHGTKEFYRERAEITKRLITEKGYTAIAVEADWPDAYRVNRYVRGESNDADPDQALSGFKRFPQWMWRNREVLDFVGWLRSYNDAQGDKPKVGFFGLDLYSMFASIQAVLEYLNKVDPEAAKRARYRYSCFDHYGENTQTYGYAASFGITKTCEDEAVAQLKDMLERAPQYTSKGGPDEFFYAEQNARLVKNAEEYYRKMFRSGVSSWNLRDLHMFETLQELLRYLSSKGGTPKIAVWEHNSHLGDARATEMGQRGEWNVGQLTREHYGAQAFLVGFTTYMGGVTAASDWDAPAEQKGVLKALPGSYEALFHDTGVERFLVFLKSRGLLPPAARSRRLERAIGVIYRPESERVSHYFHAQLGDQFDAVIHIDETHPVEPLERNAEWREPEVPETYPSGI